jgi:hypothetical protein
MKMNFSINRPHKGFKPIINNLSNIPDRSFKSLENSKPKPKTISNTNIQNNRFSMLLPQSSECNSCGGAK